MMDFSRRYEGSGVSFLSISLDIKTAHWLQFCNLKMQEMTKIGLPLLTLLWSLKHLSFLQVLCALFVLFGIYVYLVNRVGFF
jgi:hypothetical protein